MKQSIVLVLACCLASGVFADEQVDRIYGLYNRGEIARARQELHNLPKTAVRDGNRLFLSALFESSGKRTAEILEAALQADLDGKYLEEANFRLIALAEACRDTASVLHRGSAFLDRWEASPYREQLLAVLAAHSAEGSHEQERYLRLLIDQFPATYYGQYARLTKAAMAYNKGHDKTASALCRRVSNGSNDDLVAPALVLLSKIALNNNDPERALFNYNIMRERYQYAIGQQELVTALKQVSDRQSGEESTEVFEGITYSVQVGVFAQKENAKRMAGRVKAYGYKDYIRKKEISGKSYYYVMAGKFDTLKKAQMAKQKLERGENEIFKVVVDDEK